jgi:hypothetical protein
MCAALLPPGVNPVAVYIYTVYKLIGFYNRDEKCLLRGMDWVFE